VGRGSGRTVGQQAGTSGNGQIRQAASPEQGSKQQKKKIEWLARNGKQQSGRKQGATSFED
jgi:hypothetical protein